MMLRWRSTIVEISPNSNLPMIRNMRQTLTNHKDKFRCSEQNITQNVLVLPRQVVDTRNETVLPPLSPSPYQAVPFLVPTTCKVPPPLSRLWAIHHNRWGNIKPCCYVQVDASRTICSNSRDDEDHPRSSKLILCSHNVCARISSE